MLTTEFTQLIAIFCQLKKKQHQINIVRISFNFSVVISYNSTCMLSEDLFMLLLSYSVEKQATFL